MKDRDHNLVVRVDRTELAKLLALAEDADEHASQLVRRWLGQHYVARFGDAEPPEASRKKTRRKGSRTATLVRRGARG